MKIPLLPIPQTSLFFSPLNSPNQLKGASSTSKQCYASLRTLYKKASLHHFSPPKNIFECEKRLENFYRGQITLHPQRPQPYLDLGNYYLKRKMYISASVYLEQGAQKDPKKLKILEQLGKAYYGMKDFKNARKAYGAALLLHSRNPQLLQLHAEASQAFLKANAKTLDPYKTEHVKSELVADQALHLALNADAEKIKLKQVEFSLRHLRRLPKEKASPIFMGVIQTAIAYLQLSETKFPNPTDSHFVKEKLSGLALQLLKAVSKNTLTSSQEEIRNLGKLLSVYVPFIEGNYSAAQKLLSKIQHQIPAAKSLLKLIDQKHLRAQNLGALTLWETYIAEANFLEKDKTKSLFYILSVDPFEKQFGRPSAQDQAKSRWQLEKKLLLEVKRLLLEGDSATIQEALKTISIRGPKQLRNRALTLCNDSESNDSSSANILGNLFAFVAKDPPEEKSTQNLISSAIKLDRHFGKMTTVIGIAGLIEKITPHLKNSSGLIDLKHQVQNQKKFFDHLTDEILNTTPESLVTDLVIYHGAWKASNWAKTTLMKIAKNKLGLTHLIWVIGARSAAVWSEVGTIWGLTLLRDAFQHNPSRVFDSKRMLERFVFLSLTIRGIKTLGALGIAGSTILVRKFNMVAKNGIELTLGGKVLSWSLLHGPALGGIIGVDWAIQKSGLIKPGPEGFKKSLAQDILIYIKYALAAKAFGIFMGPRYYQSHLKSFKEVLRLEAEAHAEHHVKKSDYRVLSRDAQGHPDFIKTTPVQKNAPSPVKSNGHSQPIPWVKQFYRQLVDFQLTLPGFRGGKLFKHFKVGGTKGAEKYLKQFNLKLEVGKDFELRIREKTLHERIGITPPPQAKKNGGSS